MQDKLMESQQYVLNDFWSPHPLERLPNILLKGKETRNTISARFIEEAIELSVVKNLTKGCGLPAKKYNINKGISQPKCTAEGLLDLRMKDNVIPLDYSLHGKGANRSTIKSGVPMPDAKTNCQVQCNSNAEPKKCMCQQR